MKTRAEIYGNEAAALLRIVTMYPGLNMQQLLCFHPDKEEIIKTLLSHLQKQGRIFQTDTGGYFPSGWAAKSDNSLIRAAWVLLDFIGQVEYHAPGDFPAKLIFFANGELYEIVYAASGQEALINHALRDDRSGGRRIILVDNPEDICRIDCPGISGFCTVDAAGQVHYFMQPISAGCIPAKIQFMDNTLNGVIIVPRCVKRIPLWSGSHMDTYLFTANLQQHILSPGANHCQISNLFHALLLPCSSIAGHPKDARPFSFVTLQQPAPETGCYPCSPSDLPSAHPPKVFLPNGRYG